MRDNEPIFAQQKRDPSTLELRAQPRPVAQIRRSVIVGIAATGAATLFGITWWALDATRFDPIIVGEDLLADSRGQGGEGFAGLPDSYDDLEPPPLGPPLPGDLGPAVLEQERALGLAPDPDEEARRAERLRLALQARQAREAGVFFQLTGRATASPVPGVTLEGSGVTSSDGDAEAAVLDTAPEGETYNGFSIQQPISPYQLMAGSVISASLMTGINSDLPGRVLAQVTENVYDTATGRFLLIPQGARMVGTYDSGISFGQSRVQLIWERIVLPNGASLRLENLPATDTVGYSGLSDDVDFHTWSLVKGAILSTILNVGSELTLGGQGSSVLSAVGSSTQEAVDNAGNEIVRRHLDVKPTITIRPGWPIRVIVQKDLVLVPYESAPQ
jgi:type IV secretion system protein VirB10